MNYIVYGVPSVPFDPINLLRARTFNILVGSPIPSLLR